MIKKNTLIVGIVVIVLVALGAFLGYVLTRTQSIDVSPYSAVYLSTGDLYFGEFSWLPSPRIKNVWFLERRVNPETKAAEFGISPFTSSLWGPTDEIRLNPREIIFWTHLSQTSDVVRAITQGNAGVQLETKLSDEDSESKSEQ